jgi:O-antigen ligase
MVDVEKRPYHSSGTGRPSFAAARWVFALTFLAYLLFPNDDEFRMIGLGTAGFRILIMDIFVLFMIVGTASEYRTAIKKVFNRTGFWPPAILVGLFLFSFLRGVPLYGGYAIGEGRWYAAIVLMPAAYAIYDDDFARILKRIVYVAAAWHSILIVRSVYLGQAWDTSGEVYRFATGRQSLILALAGIILVFNITRRQKGLFLEWRRILALCSLFIVVLLGQTRSIFLLMPLALVLPLLMRGTLRLAGLLRGVAVTLFVGAILWFLFDTFMPASLSRSVQASADVVLESVSPETIRVLFSGDIASETKDLELSSSGNTTFRLLAWAQVIQSVDEVPGGWWVGAPLGSGFSFSDASGTLYENLDPHNDYISIVSKVGLLGLAGYIMILGYFVVGFRKCAKKCPDEYKRTELTTILSIFFLLILFVAFNAEIRSYGSHFWVWVVLGFGFKALDLYERSHQGVVNADAPRSNPVKPEADGAAEC